MYRGNMTAAATDALHERIVSDFLDPHVGADYGLSRAEKLDMVRRIKLAHSSIESATHWIYPLILGTQILSIPKSVEGAVIECGCFKGASTASLSIICAGAGRTLYVCDSFEGLPEDDGTRHRYPHFKVQGFYEKGMYAGALEEVKENIRDYGVLSPCKFIKGFFCDTLPGLNGPFVLVFADVDLASSMRDCIIHLWPKLVDNGYFYTDDSGDMEVVQLWFDEVWWQERIGGGAPGYVGSGCGLPISAGRCTLGYAQKIADVAVSYAEVPWLRYPNKSGEV